MVDQGYPRGPSANPAAERRVGVDGRDPEAILRSDDRGHRSGRPWVVASMVASVDGATARSGRSGGLGGPLDAAMFAEVRALADVILVGSATARAERYRLPDRIDAHVERRARYGRPPARLAVVSGSLELGEDLPYLDDAPESRRPIVVTHRGSPAEARDRLRDRVAWCVAGEDRVDLGVAVAALAEIGAGSPPVIVCEGGPRLLADLAAAGLVDEWLVTLAPQVVGGASSRLLRSDGELDIDLHLDRASVIEDLAFLRYLSVRPDDAPHEIDAVAQAPRSAGISSTWPARIS